MRIVFLAVFLAISGCASTEMKSYVGQDIREVMLTNGQPIGAIDMGNGVRAFQFMWGGSARTSVQTQSSTKVDSTWFGKSEIASNGSTVVSNGCVVSYLTRWSEPKESWVIYDYRIPKQLVC